MWEFLREMFGAVWENSIKFLNGFTVDIWAKGSLERFVTW